MRPSVILLSGLAAASPSPLFGRRSSPIDISGAYWNTHMIAAHSYLLYHFESIIAVFNNPKFEQVDGRTCISSRRPQPIAPPTNPGLVTKQGDEGFSYSTYPNLSITQTLKVGDETLTVYGSGWPKSGIYEHQNAVTGAYPSNKTTDVIGRVNVEYYCTERSCYTPEGHERS
ncbi:hypothetical protein E8E12_001461 [Didymella heteroderae]|uniref:Uncharacterized protein n=1 Tax=Didymella heteroderae TaxID=1769908 RepID=A0A9P4WV08_9PLEO|nr:hypothetical protein E8E12_001461 [Didymella heteroderae]